MKIYLFPFLMDLVCFVVMLHVTNEAGRQKLTNLQAAAFMGMQALVYMLVCPLAGRVLTRSNAKALLIASTLLILCVNVPACLLRQYWLVLLLIAGNGIGCVFFFNSFQTFMRGQEPAGSLASSIGRYNLAWSAGIGFGYLLGGMLKDALGPWGLAGMCVLGGLTVVAITVTHRPRPLLAAHSDGHIEPSPAGRPPVDARYVLVGWALMLLANFTQRPLATFIPSLSAESGNPATVAGTLIALLLVSQGVTSLLGTRLRPLLYRRWTLVGLHLAVIVCLGLLWIAPWTALQAALLVVLGCVYGVIFFASIYYVSNHARSSHNVGINEAIVGMGNVLGLFGSEWIMRQFGYDFAFYPATMAAAAILLVAQLSYLGFTRPAPVPFSATNPPGLPASMNSRP